MSNQANINSFLDSMDEAPADQFTAAENSFASPVGNPQQAPYTPAAVWPGEQQNEPIPQTAVQPTASAPQPQVMPQSQTPPQEQAIPQQAPPMQVITPPVEQSAAPQATEAPTTPAVNTGAQQSMLDPFEQALNAAQNQQESRMLETLATKPAFFSYGKVKESILRESSQMYIYPFSNVSKSNFSVCTGQNSLPEIKQPYSLTNMPDYILSLPDNDDHFNSSDNKLNLGHRELMEHLRDKPPEYYYTDVLIPSGKPLKIFMRSVLYDRNSEKAVGRAL